MRQILDAGPSGPPQTAVRYVGFWARVVASIVDSILLAVLMAPLTFIAFGITGVKLDDQDPANFLLSTIVPAMATLIFWSRLQSTPGKMLFHARIVDATTGAPPRAGQLVVRYLGYFVSAIVLGLGFIWIAFDAKKQGWHDKFASTVVVRDDRDPWSPAEP